MARSFPFVARLSLRRAHSSSGLGHRPLTAAARVRIPYAPFYCAWPRGNRIVTRVVPDRSVRNARVVPTSVPTSEVVRLDDGSTARTRRIWALRFIVHDCDLERLAASVVRRFLHRHTESVDLQDWVAGATALAWELSEQFDPNLGVDFDGWCARKLYLACVDRLRHEVADSRYAGSVEAKRAVTSPLSLDAVAADNGESFRAFLVDDAGDVHAIVEARVGVSAADCNTPVGWLLATRDSCRAGDLDILALPNASQGSRESRRSRNS